MKGGKGMGGEDRGRKGGEGNGRGGCTVGTGPPIS